MSAPELTEKLLCDAGGWKALKHARTLCDAGAVTSANYTQPLLKGVVREGGTEYRAGLKITSRTDIENLCTCRVSRGSGMVCAHSLAVGLAALRPKIERAVTPDNAAHAQPGAKKSSGPFFSTISGSEL